MPWKSSKTNSHKLQQDETDLRSMTVLRYHTFLPKRRVRKSVSHHGTLWHHTEPRRPLTQAQARLSPAPRTSVQTPLGSLPTEGQGTRQSLRVTSRRWCPFSSLTLSMACEGHEDLSAFLLNPGQIPKKHGHLDLHRSSDFSHLMPQVSGQKTQLIQGHMWQTGQPEMAGQERAGSAL